MSRLEPGSAFGGSRIVKPRANVYTVLLLVACLCVAAALFWEYRAVKRMKQEREAAVKPAAASVESTPVRADRSA